MSPLVALHATRAKHRESIRTNGLIGNQPNGSRPFGVYVFTDTHEFDHPLFLRGRGANRIEWSYGPGNDVWRVTYIGPLAPDRYVMNGIILLESVEPTELQLLQVANSGY